MNLGKAASGDNFGATVRKGSGMDFKAKAQGFWSFTCYDKDGNVKWKEDIENLVVNTGLDYLLDAGLSGGTQISTWYVGLTDDSPTIAAGDTSASHAGWAEATGYSESVRQTWTDAGVSSQSVTNSASKATFSINASDTIGGAFLISESTKGGTSGTLYAVGAFSADRGVVDTDSLEVTATFTMADDGA